MKRCPSCDFPNIDTDRTCFKCNTPLPDVPSPPVSTAPFSSSPLPTDITIAYPTEEEEKYLAYGATPPCTTHSLEHADPQDTSDIFEHTTPPPEAPTTSPPTLMRPTRITPKYRSFSILTILLRVFSCIQGLLFILLGIAAFLWLNSLIGIPLFLMMLLLGISSILIGFLLSYVLIWFNDVECNQRKQSELLTHIFHKLDEQRK